MGLLTTVIFSNHGHTRFRDVCNQCNVKRKYQGTLLVTKSRVLLWFAALICNKRKCNFQLEVSENKDVLSPPQSKCIDPMEIGRRFDQGV